MTTRQILICLVIGTLLVLGTKSAFTLLTKNDFAHKVKNNTQLRSVEAVHANSDSPVSLISEFGYVESTQIVQINTEVSGKLLNTSTRLAEGIKFKKGDLLVNIDAQTRAFNLKALKSDYINQVNAMLPDLKIDYPNTYSEWKDYANTLGLNSLVSKPPASENSSVNAFISRNGIYKTYNNIQSEEELLKKHKVYAPFNGSYTSIKFQIGSNVNTGANVATIIRTDIVEIAIPLKKELAANFKIGTKVNILKNNNTETQGTISRVSDFISKESQTRTVFIKVENALQKELYSGDYVQAQIPIVTEETSLKIPQSAIIHSAKVFIISPNDSTLKLSNIEIENIIGSEVTVKGISDQDLIVRVATGHLNNGMKVNYTLVK